MGGYDVLCDYETQANELTALQGQLPSAASKLFLPRCERAVDALKRVGDGFLRERVSNGLVRVNRTQGTEEIGMRRAVSTYLRSLRNATHSYSSEFLPVPRKLSLLASHDGELPDNLSDLGLLHLLRIMTSPDRFFSYEGQAGTSAASSATNAPHAPS